MSAALQVHNLRLRARRHEQLWPLRCLLENALAGMSLPALPPAAVVVVRRFHCGRLDPVRDHPLVLAARFEQALRACLAAGASCVDAQEVEQAAVVWFSDPLQPYLRLLELWLQGRVPRAWYWRSLLGTPLPRFDTAGVSGVFEQVWALPSGPRAGGVLLQSVLSHPGRARLWPRISPAVARRLLPAPGLSRAVASQPGAVPPDLPSSWRQALDEAAAVWGGADERLHWLAWQALCCHYPALCQQPQVMARIPRWLAHWRGREHPQATAAERPSVTVDIAARQRAGIAPGPTNSPIVSPSVPSPAPGRGDEAVSAERGPAGVAACLSPCSGLALLVPLLQRLGMADLLAADESLIMQQFPLRLLRAVGRRFGLDAEDPVASLFRPLRALPAVAPAPAAMVPRWRRQSRHMSLMSLQGASIAVLMTQAQLAMARYLRRHCRMSLRQLVCRPGRVTLTHTHWDVLFTLEQSDIRLRRLALDCDPGWVPWLGRVVRFHYGEEAHEYG